MSSPMKDKADTLLKHALEVFEEEAARKQKEGTNNNAKVVALLEGVEEYYKSRKEANEALGKAHFKLALAQKNNRHKLSIDDIREEISPTFFIGSENGSREASIDLDSLSLLSGLPSIEMRVAQKEFKKALTLLVKSAKAAGEIK